MIAPLRRWHVAAFALLAIAIPATIATGILLKPADPLRPNSLGPLLPTLPPEAWSTYPMGEVRLLAGVRGSRLVFRLDDDYSAPDLLLYWSLDPATDIGSAYLLAPVSRHAWSLAGEPPEAAKNQQGHWILYSRGREEIVSKESAPPLDTCCRGELR